MRTIQALLVAGLACFGLTSCNWNAFNSLLDHAPVVVFTPPGSSTGSLFVLPLPMPVEAGTTSAARMLVSSKDSDYLAVADYDLNGKVKLTEANVNERANLRGAPVHSAAVREDGMIMLGVPGAGGGPNPGGVSVALSLAPLPGGGYSFAMVPSIPGVGALSRIGISVAAGRVTGVATGDFVVVGDNSVHVVGADGKSEVAATSCQAVQLGNLTSENYPFRPVAVGDLLAGGNDEIILGGNGRVAFVGWKGTTDLACRPEYLTMGASTSFGSSLAVADFDGNGYKDLAVGAPPDKVYVYLLGPDVDLLNPITTPTVTLTNRLPNTSFGLRIAPYQLPGSASAQLLVADPAAPAGSFVGKVMLFNVTGAVPELKDNDAVATLFDSGESDPGAFGASLGALIFNPGLCVPGTSAQAVPWATNKLDVLTFFNYPKAAPDPRCFALKP